MKIPSRGRIDKAVEKLLNNKGLDQKDLMQRKSNLYTTLAVLMQIIVLTTFVVIFVPRLKTLIAYGPPLFLVMFANIAIIIFAGRNMHRLMIINQYVLVLLTFVFILLLGGIPTSCGLIMVGVAASMMTISIGHLKATIWLYITYVVTMILAGILQPWLTVPPGMTTWVNVTLYIVNTLGLSSLALMYLIRILSQNVQYEQRETNRLKELDMVKTRLFTNITHEFRTPLTIILGMADLIREKPEEWAGEGTEKIRKSGQSLLHLVNQMLELSKLESGAMPVLVERTDIIADLRHLAGSFDSIAVQKGMELTFLPGEERFIMDTDHEKLFLIVSNLLSNALKYTPKGGRIALSAGPAGKGRNEFVITVRDNGPGIDPAHLPHIFERFYRAAVNDSQGGYGLGLSLTREFVKLLNGQVMVESEPGRGSAFSVILPVTCNAPVREPGAIAGQFNSIFDRHSIEGAEGTGTELMPAEDDRPVLLAVEDNADLVRYLTALFTREYRLEVAGNGEEGLRKALELVPDIILSDVMMPVMDGITMLDKLKNDWRTSHIPVVMLTAKADIASRLEGLERGADDYLAKPFNEAELRMRLRKLIELRRKLQERYATMETPPLSDDKALHLEDAFMQKVREIMETNLDDDQFGIRQLCASLSMSRAQLYRKFKSLTDRTVNEYLISFRLHKARELLMTTGLNVSEVAYDTGFKNLSHFSRVFTEMFGKNPREFIR